MSLFIKMGIAGGIYTAATCGFITLDNMDRANQALDAVCDRQANPAMGSRVASKSCFCAVAAIREEMSVAEHIPVIGSLVVNKKAVQGNIALKQALCDINAGLAI